MVHYVFASLLQVICGRDEVTASVCYLWQQMVLKPSKSRSKVSNIDPTFQSVPWLNLEVEWIKLVRSLNKAKRTTFTVSLIWVFVSNVELLKDVPGNNVTEWIVDRIGVNLHRCPPPPQQQTLVHTNIC